MLLPQSSRPPQNRYTGDDADACQLIAQVVGLIYRRAKPAAAPIAATTISLLQLVRDAPPVKGEGDGTEVAMVPLEDGAGTPEEAVPTWIWPSPI